MAAPGSSPFGRPAPAGMPATGAPGGMHTLAQGTAAAPFGAPQPSMARPGAMPAAGMPAGAPRGMPATVAGGFPAGVPASSAPMGMPRGAPGGFPGGMPATAMPGTAMPAPGMPVGAPARAPFPATAAPGARPAFGAPGTQPGGMPASMPGAMPGGMPGSQPGTMPVTGPPGGGAAMPGAPFARGPAGFPAATPATGAFPTGAPSAPPTARAPFPGAAADAAMAPRPGMPSTSMPPAAGMPPRTLARGPETASNGIPTGAPRMPFPGSVSGATGAPPTMAQPGLQPLGMSALPRGMPTTGGAPPTGVSGAAPGGMPMGPARGFPAPGAAPGGQPGPFAASMAAAQPTMGGPPMGGPPTGAAPGGPPTMLGGPPTARGPPTMLGPAGVAAGPPTGFPPGAGMPSPFMFDASTGASAHQPGAPPLPAAFADAPPMMGAAGMSAGPRQPGMPGASPTATAPMAEVNDKYQCLPAYMSFTMGAVPQSKPLAEKSSLPFGLCVHPLAESEGTMHGQVPLVDFGALGVIRCKKCRAYINPFVVFVDAGRRWRCNLCGFINDVPPAYFQPLDAAGARVDVATRPELHCGSVEFSAPAEYTVRPPQPPVYVFVIDVSYASISSGMLHTAAATIKQCLDRLPGEGRTQIGFITFDSAVHFYNLRSTLTAPQMLVVPDVADLFIPVPDELLVNLAESRRLVDLLLDTLPVTFANNKSGDSALGPALEAAFNIMQHIGGKMVVMQSTLPSIGIGKLKPRENPKMLGSEKEFTLLAPESGDDGNFYKAKAVDFSRQQISVDTFLFAHNYTDVATIGALSRYTAGQVYYYPRFSAALDGARFSRDLARDLTRVTGFEAVMRIRTTRGLAITNFYGNFFIRGTDLLALPNVTCDTAFNVEFTHEEVLQPGSVIAVQAALLYTTSGGQRRINVHTLCKPVTSVLSDLFKNVSVDAVANMMAKVALDNALRLGLQQARRYLHKVLVDIIRAYRASNSTVSAASGPARALPSMASAPGAQQVVDSSPPLPDTLQSLPALALGLQKCTLYRGGEHIRSDERSSLVYRMLTMPIANSQFYAYPRFFALHELDDKAGRPDPSRGPDAVFLPRPLSLTAANLKPSGVYLLDDTVETFMWIGKAAPHALLQFLFGHNLEGVDVSTVVLPPPTNDFAARVHAILTCIRADIPQQPRLRLVREGSNDEGEVRFHWHMFEDRQNFPGGLTALTEYMPIVLREAAQLAQVPGM